MTEKRNDQARCDHASSEHLFLHVREQLDASAAAALRDHLAACEECRERESTLRWMQEQVRAWGEALFADHVASEEIVQYVESRQSLPVLRRGEIERHLFLCQACAGDTRLVEEVGTSLAHEPVPWASRLAGWAKGLGRTAAPAPIWAYALVLMLLYPAYLGVRDWLAPSDSTRPAAVSVFAPQVLEPTERAGRSQQVVETVAGQPLLLEFQVPVMEGSDLRYDARLVDADAQIVWTGRDLRSIDAYGTFFLLLEPSQLRAGVYRLIVTEHTAAGAPSATFEFDFALRPR